jgi:hypothetical protein
MFLTSHIYVAEVPRGYTSIQQSRICCSPTAVTTYHHPPSCTTNLCQWVPPTPSFTRMQQLHMSLAQPRFGMPYELHKACRLDLKPLLQLCNRLALGICSCSRRDMLMQQILLPLHHAAYHDTRPHLMTTHNLSTTAEHTKWCAPQTGNNPTRKIGCCVVRCTTAHAPTRDTPATLSQCLTEPRQKETARPRLSIPQGLCP